MARLIGEEWQGDIRVRWFSDDATGEVTVEYHQDAQSAIDLVSAINSEGAPTIDGLGKPVVEVPVAAAMEWAKKRGIPWEKLLYSNEYDAEFKRFAQEHSRLAYKASKSVHTVQ